MPLPHATTRIQTLELRGPCAATAGTSSGEVFVFRIGEQERPLLAVLSDARCPACVRKVSFSPDASVLYCACDDATIWQYDLSEINPPVKAGGG